MLKLLWKGNNKEEEAEHVDNNNNNNKEDSTPSTPPTLPNSLTSSNDSNDLNDNDCDMNDYDINNINLEWRHIIFIRHGNSIWNESTDNASFKNPYSAAKAISAFTSGVKEYAKLKWSSEYKHEDSIYVDTPLSPKGMNQAYNLSLFLKHHESLRDEQKLLYLQQHQKIASPIKDAWRALQQYKFEQTSISTSKEQQQPFSSLCDDALSSLTKAMQSIEYLMANVKPYDAMNNNIDKIDNNIEMDISSILDILIGKNIRSKIVCSNLRRAISTCVLSLWHRLRNSNEKIYILSCLQEIGINVDTHTHTSQFEVPHVSNFEMMSQNLDTKALNDFYSKRIETIYNYGSKVTSQFLMESQKDTQKRMELFAKWLFMDDEQQTDNDEKDDRHHNKNKNGFKTIKNNNKNCNKNSKIAPSVIAFGHSVWIRTFFNHYLPSNNDFIGKNTKLANCGVVAFKFYYNKKSQKFGIAPNTVTVVYKGFGAS